jgi:hypothetical protein
LENRICRVQHAKILGYCAKGMRVFCKLHGLDYTKFVREGFTPEELLNTNDIMAEKLVKLAQERGK